MTFQEIKKLRIRDFEDNNENVWNEIEELPLNCLRELLDKNGFNREEVNKDVAISDSLHEILQEKTEEHLKETVIDKLTDEQKEMFSYLFFDKDGTWDILRKWNMVEGNW